MVRERQTYLFYNSKIYMNSLSSWFKRDNVGEPEVGFLLVEFKCPEHGLERFRIKIIKRFNMTPNTILPRFRTRPKAGEIKFLAVGRNVTDAEIERYFVNYFREKGLWNQILRMRLL